MIIRLALAGGLLLASYLPATQDPPPPNSVKPTVEKTDPLPVPEGAPAEISTLVKELANEGVTVDFEKRKVEVKGALLLDKMNAGYPIEYLIVNEHGKSHESLGIVRCTPSKLNAAFLALGLEPGKSVTFVKKDPPPPMEKLVSGEEREYDVLPPQGTVVDIAVKWQDDKGGEHLQPIEDLIVYITNGKPLPRRGFVYVGSRFSKIVTGTERKERFMADVEGDVVSLYISGYGNCLFDMNSDEGVESYLYDVNAKLAPPRGTKVSFVFQLR